MGSEPRRGTALLIVLAALLPLCLAGWLLWQSLAGRQDPAGGAFPVSGSATGSGGGTADSPREETAADTGRGGEGDAGRKTGGDGPEAEGVRRGPLVGKVVVLDPGHNVGNRRHTREISRQVTAGPLRKECDTTGTATDGGYPEASFAMDVAHRTRELLRKRGATVKLTHDGDRPWGPCVDERARIGNAAHADAVVSIHADGSAPGNHGFHVIVPATARGGGADTTAITGPSRALGEQLLDRFASTTSMPPADYVGSGSGIIVRGDLGGLNLSRVPKVFIECGNMRDTPDAGRLSSGRWRQWAAEGITEGITSFLTQRA